MLNTSDADDGHSYTSLGNGTHQLSDWITKYHEGKVTFSISAAIFGYIQAKEQAYLALIDALLASSISQPDAVSLLLRTSLMSELLPAYNSYDPAVFIRAIEQKKDHPYLVRLLLMSFVDYHHNSPFGS